MPAIGTPAIDLAGLTKQYQSTRAVDQLDLQIGSGEVFGLLGPNGAGKTTTILMILGLTEPTAGRVRVAGLDPARAALEVKQRVGYLPDDVGFYDELSGRENLRYTARLNRLPAKQAEPLIDSLLAEVGLTGAADRRVRGYSRGMRQRLGLADALVKSPSILILDEPTVNIDPEGVRDILALVGRLRDERGTTVLLSSHLLHQVEQVCDRIGLFLQGRLAALGTVDELTAALDAQWVIEVEVDGGDAELPAAVDGVAGVTGLRRDGPTWLVAARRDIRTEVAAALAGAGLHLLLLRRRGADLDAIYHRYFSEDVDGHDDDR